MYVEMYALLKHALSGRGIRVFAASALTFTLLNFVENLIHYAIGRRAREKHGENKEFEIVFPEKADLSKIVIVMIVFAVLQGILTCVISEIC